MALLPGIGLTIAILAFQLMPAIASQEGSWLDEPLSQWNEPGMTIPAAPPRNEMINPRCQETWRGPEADEETVVAEGGWPSFGNLERDGNVAVVFAAADADGMCRPTNYQLFVFVDGQFVGTLSPVLMGARTDGAYQRVKLDPEHGSVTAQFVRYAAQDPLCCPSLPPSVVTYRVDSTAAGQVLVAIENTRAETP